MFNQIWKTKSFKIWIGWSILIFAFLFITGIMPLDNLFVNTILTAIILVLTASVILFIRMFIRIIKN